MRKTMKFMNSIIKRMGGSWTACEVLRASKENMTWTENRQRRATWRRNRIQGRPNDFQSGGA